MLMFAAGLVFNGTVGPLLAGLPQNLQAAAEAEKVLLASLPKIESFWLKGDGNFLLGNSQPTIADLILVCEIMQLQVDMHVFFILLFMYFHKYVMNFFANLQ